jgi:hydroxymethylglutaryl-CoA lyase
MAFPSKVNISEVCPRDGWQNMEFIDTNLKVEMVKRIISTGVKEIEITSFVHPKFVPQFSDAVQVVEEIKKVAPEDLKLLALIPNKKGADRAAAAGIDAVNYVMSASEEHNKRNVKRTIEDSFNELQTILSEDNKMKVRLAFACVFGSPFGDPIDIDNVIRICEDALKLGVEQIGLADSGGLSTPDHTRKVLREITKYVDRDKLSLHLHDTRGMGIANAYVALEEGIDKLDSALGGLGGCPFIPGAAGNISTEDLANMSKQMGLVSGIDFDKLTETSLFIAKSLNGNFNSRVLQINKIKNSL